MVGAWSGQLDQLMYIYIRVIKELLAVHTLPAPAGPITRTPNLLILEQMAGLLLRALMTNSRGLKF